jgi:hypothetical protein
MSRGRGRIALAAVLAALFLPVAASGQEAADTAAPMVTCGTADGIWHADNVSVSCTATDDVELADPSDASFGLSTSVPAGEETNDAQTGSKDVCDTSGNCSNVAPIGGNMIDRKDPVVLCNGAAIAWAKTDALVTCTSGDLGSGLVGPSSFQLSTAVPVGTEDANASTSSDTSCDAVGNCAPVGPVDGNHIDKARPQTSVSMSHAAGRWSHDRTIHASFNSLDEGSGVDGFSLSWNHKARSRADRNQDLEETATQRTSPILANGKWYFHLRTRDVVGNWTATQHRGPFFIDGTPPRVDARSASGKVNNGIHLLYQSADNAGQTRERLTISRNGNVVRSWSRSMGRATWTKMQSVSWSTSRAGSYRFCASAWDRATNTRHDCAAVTIAKPQPQCHPSYKGACLNPNASDYDCAGGSGNGPYYVQGPIYVIGYDEYGLDADGDGIGCE